MCGINTGMSISRVDDKPRTQYELVRDTIASRIRSGDLGPGEKLPSERVLCDEFSLSRVTIRRALSDLDEMGAIDSLPGRGWFVSDGSISDPSHMLRSFSMHAIDRGLAPSSQVVRQEIRPANLDEAETLEVAPGSSLGHLERVRLLDDLAVVYEVSIVPIEAISNFAELDFAASSLYRALMEGSGRVPTTANCQVQARAADAVLAGYLGLEEGAPVLAVDQMTFDQNGEPLEINRASYRSDRHRFRATLSGGQLL